MKAKPIIFSGAMVRAILDGTKTQFREIVKPQPTKEHGLVFEGVSLGGFGSVSDREINATYEAGTILWVREAWNTLLEFTTKPDYKVMSPDEFVYRADNNRVDKWKPSIHMPREASRITLEVTAVRCERLQDISEADAIAEGVERFPTAHGKFVYENYRKNPFDYCDKALSSYATLWQSIHGPDSWNENPFVWVYEFRMVKP